MLESLRFTVAAAVITLAPAFPAFAQWDAQEMQKFRPNQSGQLDRFGASVAISENGDTIVVGSPDDGYPGALRSGSAYVYTRSGHSSWSASANVLAASDRAARDRFGNSVAISADGNTIVVGSAQDNHAGGTDSGSAYVYTRSGNGWTQRDWLVASDRAASDNFGDSLAISADGGTIVVGSPRDDHAGGTDSGSAYVFTRSGNDWTQEDWLVASDRAASDYFGNSVAVSADGDTIVVGSLADDHAGGTNSGSAYVFLRSGDDWTQRDQLLASDRAWGDLFGSSVAISAAGDTIVVGSYLDDHAGGTNSGSAYVFNRIGDGWTQQDWLVASDRAARDYFGRSVTISADGDVIAVGSYLDDHAGGTDSGSASMFVRSKGHWTQRDWVVASDRAEEDHFGSSVALSGDGDTMVVGSPAADDWDMDSGLVYAFDVAVRSVLTGYTLSRGTHVGGNLLSLIASDPYSLKIEADAGKWRTSEIEVRAISSVDIPSRLDLRTETRTNTTYVQTRIWLHNVRTLTWDLVSFFYTHQADLVTNRADLPNPEDYVRASDGLIRVKIQMRDGGPFTMFVDHVQLTAYE